jgi:hypothetical protein
MSGRAMDRDGWARRLRGALLAALALGACAGCGSRSTAVVDPQSDLNLSGNWNDVDARTVAEDVARQLAEGAWVGAFTAARGRPPVVRIGHVRARTRAIDDEIEPGIILDDLARTLIATGRVRVAAGRGEAGVTRAERGDVAAGAAQAPVAGRELAPDFILSGSILTQDDSVLDPGVTGSYKAVKFYQADFQLVDLTTNEVVWRGSAERKKSITQSTTGW